MSSPDWQPIETAPKDMSDIIVWGPDVPTQTAYWAPDWYGDKSKPGWMASNLDEEYGAFIHPTHWMPLPEPPKVGAGT